VRAFKDLPIGKKISRVALLGSLTGLVMAMAAFVVYDVHTFRGLLARRITTEAQLLGFNSVSALVFKDPDTAASTLASLKEEPSAALGAIYGQDGALFASFVRDAGTAVPPRLADPTPGHRFTSRRLEVTHPIRFEDARIGNVLIWADLDELRARFWRYAGMVVVVLAGALLVGNFATRPVQRAVTRPILQLAEVATQVSERRDYSLRATPTGGQDEIDRLLRTFNEMLAEIERQHGELHEAHVLLEARVEQRTRELESRSRELAAANKELESFSYSVSHDLRAPLRAIDGFSQALLANYAGRTLDAQGTHYLARVRAGTQRMAELIDDMLHLARVSRADLVRTGIDLTRAARSVADDLRRQHPGRDVDVSIADGLHVNADPALLTILLENLLGNAWKFTAKRAQAVIEVGRLPAVNGNGDAFYVRDNGAGFDMTYAGKLFGVFQRLHHASDFEGTGIGLATVHRIVARHGGRIWAEGAVEAGATFYFQMGGSA
jgi:signal transduction histidine kinase